MSNRDPKTRDELATSEALRVGLLKSALDCVIVMNDRGEVVEWNQAAAETFGYRRDAALGRPLAELIVPARLREEHAAGLQRYLASGRSNILDQRIEVRAMCADQSEIDVELTVTPVRQRRTLFVGYLRDITERKLAAESLKRAKEAAEASSRAKSRFLASMSHEFRTPLTSILGFSELLSKEEPADQARRESWLGHIRGSAEHLLALINDILDLSKIEAGQLHVERSRVHLLSFFAELEHIVQPLADEKGLRFTVLYHDPVPEYVFSDPLRLRQIALNLLGNAIKFTDEGFVRVEISGELSGSDIVLVLAVHDSGPGIPPESQEDVFSAFTQTAGGRALGGTGLGLDISRRLARKLGGDLTLESLLGQGSVFRASVAAGPVGTTTLVNTSSYDLRRFQAEAKRGVRSLHGRRVLLVDDHLPNRDLVSYVLEQKGANVTTATDGEDCLRVVRELGEHRIDAILMDMQMPVLDGYDTTRRLRQRGFRRPIIALTAHSMSDDRDRCLAAGCDAYLSKPIDEATLLSTLLGHLQTVPVRSRSVLGDSKSTEPPAREAPAEPDPQPAAEAHLVALHSTKDGDPRFRPLLERFVASLHSDALPTLRGHIEGRDVSALRAVAHKLAGTGGGYGFPQVTAEARAIQTAVDQEATWEELEPQARGLADLLSRIALGPLP